MKHLPRVCLAAVALAMAAPGAFAQRPAAPDLVGLWEAKGRFGPDVAGRLVVDHPAGGWRASIAGRAAAVRVARDSVAFELPDGSGAFIGRFDARRTRIVGHWIQPRTVESGQRYASPLVLEGCGTGCFAATVAPLADAITWFIRIDRRADGTLGAFIRNPERNLGRFIRLHHIEADSAGVRLLDARGQLLTRGTLHDGVMTVSFESRGGTYDFHRVPEGAFTFFHPRGRPAVPYTYTPPLAREDGWPVGTLEEVGISRDRISELVRSLIASAADSIGAYRLHGLLIARHGKLVLEEYFHGEDADHAHETRSASKTVESVLVGAAMQAGMDVGPDTRVYATMRPGARDLDPRAGALTLERLLTMSSGLDCDDGNDASPGNEETITQQEENPDWYGMILDLKMIRQPGDSAVYCSIQPHLAGGVLARATGRSIPDLMYDLVGGPLGMQGYYVPITPSGDAYMGGGWRFRPRDFMKLGQLYLNGGTWNGRRIVSEAWVRRSVTPRYPMGSRARYGYLWWVVDYPYAERTVQAYYASGNGGQEVMAIPALDLVIAVYGGNYNDGPANFQSIFETIPRYILPAVAEGR
ncbi:serine hydrolase [Longimicrobium sp.]|uniref:serine hydrolase domain-containing protein n=1 Tax=Longimicrobium sp. TaxID=2029185 RepID=UPI002CBA9012|nr:serine hydrolase [Longimicrobium sp.]HSU13672.1 serine hydrolase [Longimicrobium sp.]